MTASAITLRRAAALVALTAGLATAGAAAAQSTLEEARENGFVRAAFANEAPFGFATPAGELTGESPEIAKEIFSRLGVPEVDGVLTEWASLIPGLNAGRFDLIAAGMFITPERCEQVAFSNPTYRLGQAFLVQAGNPMALHSYGDVAANPDVTLGVMAGAVERGYAEDAGIPDDQITELPDQASMLAAVRAGRVDAAALTALSIQRMAEQGGDAVERATPFTTPEGAQGYGAFAFRKEDEALLQAFNEELATFIGSPEHLDLVREFGFTEQELPGDVTAEDLCQG